MYLQAHWADEFDPESTKLTPVHPQRRLEGLGPNYVRGTRGERWGYASGKGWRAVDLPYAGGTMSMTIILPDDMASFVVGLNAAELAAMWKSEKTHDVTLTMPRFKADSHIDLASDLAAMGMPAAFDPKTADFSGINGNLTQPIYIAKVIHQATIDVAEDGHDGGSGNGGEHEGRDWTESDPVGNVPRQPAVPLPHPRQRDRRGPLRRPDRRSVRDELTVAASPEASTGPGLAPVARSVCHKTSRLASPAGFEPTTRRLEGGRSIH